MVYVCVDMESKSVYAWCVKSGVYVCVESKCVCMVCVDSKSVYAWCMCVWRVSVYAWCVCG